MFEGFTELAEPAQAACIIAAAGVVMLGFFTLWCITEKLLDTLRIIIRGYPPPEEADHAPNEN